MKSTTSPLTAARAAALFVSPLSAGSRPTRAEVVTAVRTAVRVHAGVRGCAAEVAAAYGAYPETAPARMCWALHVVATVYPAGEHTAPSVAVRAA